MRIRCLRCRRAMLAPRPGEICATCLHEANRTLMRRRITQPQPQPAPAKARP